MLEAIQLVCLGRAGSAADAITAGAAAQQHDHIAGSGALAADVGGRGSTHNSANLHALCHITGVVDLVHLTGSQTDLVAVGGVTGGCGGDQLALGQLAGHGLADRLERVACAGDTHSLIDVAATGQRVADGTADAGGSAAEGLDLGGVVVGLVLEQEQPVLLLTVHITLDLDGAGIDLLALVKVLQNAALLQRLGTDGRAVHQGAVFLVAAQLGAHRHVAVKGFLHHGVVDLHIVQNGAEGGVAAVIGPVGIDHLDLGDGGVALLGAEVLLTELDIPQIHGQTLFLDELGKTCLIQLVEALQHCHGSGHGVLHLQGLFGLQRSLAGLHRVDDILFDLGHLLGGQSTLQQIDAGRAHQRALALTDELDALGSRGCTLVELTGQILHREGHALGSGQLGVGVIHRRLAEHGADALVEQCFVDAFHIVAVQQAQTGQVLDAQQAGELVFQTVCLDIKAGLFFHINTIDHWVGSPFVFFLTASLPALSGHAGRYRCAYAAFQS